ncbi:hypothetical protein RCG21_19275 [Bacillus salipaludis]|uniref:Uncharacterized protein n=1 Tax=Bacillus salipaludis TaxID=2547811 RepID=A0AA90TQR0_9BACI|nr:hypothetical protein [Bacillus salipaludis]MDQ6598471.1 hypothetical protein [Bacillus salipaludis]
MEALVVVEALASVVEAASVVGAVALVAAALVVSDLVVLVLVLAVLASVSDLFNGFRFWKTAEKKYDFVKQVPLPVHVPQGHLFYHIGQKIVHKLIVRK